MSDAMTHYTPWAVFASVFVNQAGLPVPVVPSLVIATRSGRTLTALVIALALAGCASVGRTTSDPQSRYHKSGVRRAKASARWPISSGGSCFRTPFSAT